MEFPIVVKLFYYIQKLMLELPEEDQVNFNVNLPNSCYRLYDIT